MFGNLLGTLQKISEDDKKERSSEKASPTMLD
jgi:hypothetical protein